MKLHGSIVVAGAHRSGTTIIGDVLSSKLDSIQIYEPFNVQSGISSLEDWYMHIDGGKYNGKNILEDFMSGYAQFRNSGIRDSLHRLINRENISLYTASAWKYRAISRLPRKSIGRIVIKDPFLTFSSKTLIERYNCKLIFTVKHPCAYYMSLLRMGWHDSTPIYSLLKQGIISTKDVEWANNPVKQTALFWNAINRYVAFIVSNYPRNATFIYHDSFCQNPAKVFTSALNDVGLESTREELSRLRKRTTGYTIIPNDNTLHVLNRRAIDMPDSWQERLSYDDKRLIVDVCGPVLQNFVS